MTKLDELAKKADRLFVLREQRLAAQKVVDEMQDEEKTITAELIAAIDKSDARGVVGQKVRVTVVTKPTPTVTDWSALQAHIVATGQFDLLQKRLAEPAVRERWQDEKEVPGVGVFNVVRLSLSKV